MSQHHSTTCTTVYSAGIHQLWTPWPQHTAEHYKMAKRLFKFSSTDNNNYYYCLHLQITTSEFAMLSSFKMQHYRYTFHWQQMSQMPQGKTYGKEIWDMIEFFKFKYKHNLVAVFLNFVLDFSFVCNLYQFTTPIIMSALDNGFVQLFIMSNVLMF